jgi:hypothetical protein
VLKLKHNLKKKKYQNLPRQQVLRDPQKQKTGYTSLTK